ncbi:M48 family metallopeptidase [Candidatus Micrarchaeota archaeon]|nr:M48 family metallopeptidase [Candidatus Micrarchaeota archaeon]
MYDQINANKRKSLLLVLFFFALIAILGSLMGLFFDSIMAGLAVSVGIAVLFFLIQYYTGDRLILAISGARKATKQENAYLVNSIEALSIAAGIPQPEIYIIEDTALNAFATGRDPKHSKIVVTTGLLKAMNRLELEGVLAHEMSHVKNYDIRFMLLVITLVGVVTLISDLFLRMMLNAKSDNGKGGGLIVVLFILAIILRILAPIIAYLIHFAISREREYLADASGAMMTRYPEGLASALEKIKNDKEPLVEVANQSTASLYISNPLRNSKGFLNGLFSTHPPLEDRIKRLRAM